MRFLPNLIFSMGVMIFLVTFFSPDEAITIYAQTFLFFILIGEIATNGVITFIATIVFVAQVLLNMVFFFIDLDPQGVLILQSEALVGSAFLFQIFKDVLGDFVTNVELILDVEIIYEPYQLPETTFGIVIDSLGTIGSNIFNMLTVNLIFWLWPVINGFSDGLDYFLKGLENAKNIMELGLVVATFLFINGFVEGATYLLQGIADGGSYFFEGVIDGGDYFFNGLFGGVDYFFDGVFGGISSILSGDLSGFPEIADGILGGIVGSVDGLWGGGVEIIDGIWGGGVEIIDGVWGGAATFLDGSIGAGVATVDAGVGAGVATVDAVVGGAVEIADGVLEFICFWC